MRSKKHLLIAVLGTVAVIAAAVPILYLTAPHVGQPGNVSQGTDSSAHGGIAVYPTPSPTIPDCSTNGIALPFRTSGKYFYAKKSAGWSCTYLKGVNMGLTLPTTNLNDPDIPYATYIEWFGQIAAMNANTVKVFSIMNPDFYVAFSDYNAAHPDAPLYLLQGVWFSEDYLYDIGDAFGDDGTIVKCFERGVREATDVIHGQCDYTSYGSITNAVYDRDISPYVAGFILGLEWPSDFVIQTNQNNAHLAQYTGNYLTTAGAAPFEIFLAQIGDNLIRYETETYKQQRPVAFLNWSTTDPLTHTNEPFEEEDAVSVNTEAIRATSQYVAGLFAALDIYPYYPEFLNYQPEYLAYRDESGKSDPYRAYLADLQTAYSVPVIVAEYGVPTSRGIAHTSVTGFNQGGLSETQQGDMVVAMAKDIALEGYAGAMLFSWQDEWFKQTWNTVKYGAGDTTRRGLNVECAEQRYGILAYEPGAGQSIVYPDGDTTDWNGQSPAFSANGLSVYVKSDEGYLYLLVRFPDGQDWQKTRLAIPLSLTGHGSSYASAYSLQFSKPTDFILLMDGRSNTRLLTDARYDLLYYQYSVAKHVFPRNTAYEKLDSGLFNTIHKYISNEIVLPLTGETIQPRTYEAGLLHYGNANPGSSDFDSLADFCAGGQQVELRLPWYLLNVMSGTQKVILDDFYTAGGVSFTKGTTIGVGAALLSDSTQTVTLADFDWQEITQSTYHSRLKQSYAIIQRAFADLMRGYS